MPTPTPPSLEHLRKLRAPLRNTYAEHRSGLTHLENIATAVTTRIGTMGFFLIVIMWTASWIGWNILAPVDWRFDPYPAFVFWLFISNMIQIMLMPLIMLGQNLQGRHLEARAQADFEVNVKAEREIETVLQHLENQNELILKILARFERVE